MRPRKGLNGWAVLAVTLLAGIGLYATQVEAQLPGGSEGIPGYQRVQASSASSTALNKSAAASCPAGKVATGGGHEVSGKNPGSVAVYASRPTSDTTWQAQAKRTVNISKTWTLTAFVICATGSGTASPSPSPTASPSPS